MTQSPIKLTIALAVSLACACTPADETADEATMQGESPSELTAADAPFASDVFIRDVQSIVQDLDDKVDALATTYADAEGEAASTWDATQRGIVQAREELLEDVMRVREIGDRAPAEIRGEIVDGVETLVVAVEQARSGAAESAEEFVEVSRAQLDDIDFSLQTLTMKSASLPNTQEREQIAQEVDQMELTAEDLTQRVDAIGTASADELADRRVELSQAIALLSGSVYRRALAIPQDQALQ
jgi:hypothetical protein